MRISIAGDHAGFTYSAHQGVEHDNMNMPVLEGALYEVRHVRRLAKVHAIEEKYGR
jgi:hypothetical protein